MAVVERRSQLFKLPSDVLQRSMDRMGCFDACMQFRETYTDTRRVALCLNPTGVGRNLLGPAAQQLQLQHLQQQPMPVPLPVVAFDANRRVYE